MTAPAVLPDHPGNVDDDLDHFYCCDKNVAYCGLDISGMEDRVDGEFIICPLCKLAQEVGGFCRVCGS